MQGKLFHPNHCLLKQHQHLGVSCYTRLFHPNHCLLKQHQHLGVSCYTRVISPKPLLTEATPTPGSELLYKEGYFTQTTAYWSNTNTWEWAVIHGYFTQTTAYWSNTNTWEWAVIQGRLFHPNHCLLKQHQHLGVSCYTREPKPLLTEATPTPGSELLYKGT